MAIPEDATVNPAANSQAPTEALLRKANAQGLSSLMNSDDGALGIRAKHNHNYNFSYNQILAITTSTTEHDN